VVAQTRISYMHDLLTEVRQLPPQQADALIAAHADDWARLEKDYGGAWVDQDVFFPMFETLRRELGDDDFRELFRRLSGRLVKAPFLQALVESVIRISGLRPHTLLKVAPKARQGLVKNYGVLRYHRVGVDHAELRMTDAPASCWSTGTTALLLVGSMEGLIDLCNQEPIVSLTEFDGQAGSGVIDARWAEKGG